jgi:VCBS repeat-containing protein
MDSVLLATAAMAANAGQVQLAMAGKMLRMQVDSSRSAVQLIDAAQQNINRLANVAAGVGTNLDVSA